MGARQSQRTRSLYLAEHFDMGRSDVGSPDYGSLLYDTIMHIPPTPRFHSYTPTLDFIFDFALWIFGFGCAMGESLWRKYERDYDKDDHVA